MDQRKRELEKAYLAAERKAKRQSFPLSVADLQDLFGGYCDCEVLANVEDMVECAIKDD